MDGGKEFFLPLSTRPLFIPYFIMMKVLHCTLFILLFFSLSKQRVCARPIHIGCHHLPALFSTFTNAEPSVAAMCDPASDLSGTLSIEMQHERFLLCPQKSIRLEKEEKNWATNSLAVYSFMIFLIFIGVFFL